MTLEPLAVEYTMPCWRRDFFGPMGAPKCVARVSQVRDCGPGGRTRKKGASWPGSTSGGGGISLKLKGSTADAIAAAALRLVELFVGALDDVGRAAIGCAERRATHADGHRNAFALEDEGVLRDARSQVHAQRSGAFQRCFWQ